MNQKSRLPNAKTEAARRIFDVHFFIALAICVALAAIEYASKESEVNYWLTQQAYSFLQHNLPFERQGRSVVQIVDISRWTTTNGLRSVPSVPGLLIAPELPYTDRYVLESLLSKISIYGPTAIGIDIDFSPYTSEAGGNWTPPPHQYDFFDFCKELQTPTREKIPVFLGIHRTLGYPPQGWLDGNDYTNLAAGISMLRPPSHMPLEFKLREDSPPLPGMANALSKAHQRILRTAPSAPPSWLMPFVHGSERRAVSGASAKAWVSSFPVNYYSTFPQIVDHCIRAEDLLDPTGERNLTKSINKHVILIGCATMGEASDTVCIPTEPDPVPGIYTHACATATLLEKPLFEVKESWGLALSSITSMSIHVMVRRIRRKGTDRKIVTEFVIMVLAIGISLGAALMLTRWAQILWLQVTVLWTFLLAEFLLHCLAFLVLPKTR